MKIPDQGIPKDDLFARMASFRGQDLSAQGVCPWAYEYDLSLIHI